MFAIALAPATLSLLVLAAHFLRRGALLECGASLLVLGVLLFVRRPWVPRLVQAVLGLAAVLWVLTAVTLVRQRVAEHGEAGRLAAILGAVVVVNVLAALLLGTRRVKSRYLGGSGGEAPR